MVVAQPNISRRGVAAAGSQSINEHEVGLKAGESTTNDGGGASRAALYRIWAWCAPLWFKARAEGAMSAHSRSVTAHPSRHPRHSGASREGNRIQEYNILKGAV
jgi:hypothetical protein